MPSRGSQDRGSRRPSQPKSAGPAKRTSAKRPSAKARTGWRALAFRYRRLLLALGLAALVGLIGFVYVVSRIELPPDVPLAQTSMVLDAKGHTLAELHAEQNRVRVKLSKISPVFQKSVLAAEDRDFYHHSGLDPRGIVRALWTDLRGRHLQGGSTITQQLVKNAYLSPQRSFVRKLREAILAVKVEQRYSKHTILERYLNTIYFGRGAYGIEAASQAYFAVPASDLDLAQSALLAGMIHAPEREDPVRFPDRAKVRRRQVLDALVKAKAVSRRAAAEANDKPLGVGPTVQAATVPGGPRGYFIDYVRQQVIARFGERLTYSGGLRITTTLDADLQTAAEKAIATTLTSDTDPAAALVALDDNGQVVAFVGGRDFAQSKVNLALGRDGGGSGRQAGSTFKAFVLGAAIEGGIKVKETFPAPPSIVLPGWDGKPVTNFNHESFPQPIDLFDATAHSVNTVYAQLIGRVGAKNVVDFAKKAGIASPLNAVPSLTLGTSDVSPFEMASAFMTFADRGERLTPFSISKITDGDGAVLFEQRPERTRVIPKEHADLINNVLAGVVDHGTGTAAKLGRAVAGKTGTTDDFADAWFVGYTPRIGAAVWMGYPDGTAQKMTSVHGRSVTGGSFPAQIWKLFISHAVKGRDTGSFVAPPGDLLAGPTTSSSSSSSTAPPTTASPTTTQNATTTTKANATTTTRSATTTTRPSTTSTTTKSGKGP